MSPGLAAIVATLPDADRSFVELTRLLSVAMVAAYLGMTRASVHASIRRGKLKAHRVGGHLHVSDSEVERFRAARGSVRDGPRTAVHPRASLGIRHSPA